MTITPRRSRMAAVFTTLALLVAAPAAAQDWPDKPVTILIPFAAGGGNDTVAREMGRALEERLGVPFTPVNAPGAGGFVAAQQLVAGRNDGYTLSHQSLGTFVLTSMMNEQVLDPLDDLTYVAQMATLSSAVAVATDSPYQTLEELTDALATSDGSMTWGHTGEGGFHHINGVSLLQAIGASARDVPFKGSSASRAALLGGQIDYALLSSSNYLGFEGEMRFLAFLSDESDEVFPDVPTVGDLGIEMTTVSTPSVWVLPNGVDPAIVDRLASEIEAVVATDDYRTQLLSLGIAPSFATGEAVRAKVEANREAWNALVQSVKAAQ